MTFANQKATVYNDSVVRQFAIMTVVWGVVGMLVGVIIAAQLAWPELNLGIPWLTYGRLRPLHTNAVIFAFGGCGLFASAYYVVQRTCHVRLFGDELASFTFWGWQLVILLAAITLPLGYTTGKEYAELEWPIDILITLVWVSFAIVFFGTKDTWKHGWDTVHQKLRALGSTTTELWLAEGQSHGFFNKQPWRNATLRAADRFLVQQGLLKGDPTLAPPATGEKFIPAPAPIAPPEETR